MASRLERLLPLLARLSEVDGELKSLADLAAADGRSPWHLQRVFRAEVGESPLQFSRRVRLQRAAASLLVTETSVLDIALDAGFETHEGFTRAFGDWFGETPSAFRARRADFDRLVRHHRTHLEIAHRTAPCVSLYRVSTDGSTSPSTPNPSGDSRMSYEITKKTLDEAPFLFMRRSVKPEAIAEALGAMLPEVYQFATSRGIPFAGPPTTRYPSYGPGLVTIEAGLPVAGPAEGEGDVLSGSLLGGTVASTVHQGAYDGLTHAHEAMQRWIEEHGETVGGAPWEVYLTDPGEVPDPADWRTEVVWPLAS